MNGGKCATSSTPVQRPRSCFCCGNSDDPIVDFPTGKHNRMKWVRCLQHRYKVKNIRSGDGLCVQHFRSDRWKLDKNNQVILMKSGLPKFFNHPVYKNCKKAKNQLKGKNDPAQIAELQSEDSFVSDVNISTVVTNNCETIQLQLEGAKTNAEQTNNTDLINDHTENDGDYVSDKEKIDLVMQNRFAFVKGQVPQKLTPEQTQIVQDLVANPDNLSKATRKTMLHCTVCSIHIGTSVIAQFDRFVHPILNTLMCESCYIFYTTGVFTKDDDGSELYCKWCAQGGTVMCCSKCPLVFCQECIIRNLGMQALDSIDSNDDWECFRCKPSQISIIQIMTAALHEYSLKKIAYALSASDDEILQEDISQCCDKPKLKRRNEDEEYVPAAKKIKLKINVNSAESNKKTNNKNQTTAILLNKAIQPQPPPPPLQISEPPVLAQVGTNAANTTPAPPMIKIRADLLKDPKAELHDEPPLLSPEPTTPFFRKSLAVMPAGLSLVDSMPKMREQLSAKMGVNLLRASPPPLVPSSPPPLIPTTLSNNIAGNKEEDEALAWLRTAMENSKLGVQSLLLRYDKIGLDSDKCKRHPGELAELHNKMQHVMSQCTNLLIETRKNMHREFLAYLHKKNVSHSSTVKHPDKLKATANGGLGLVKTLAPQPALMKSAPHNVVRPNPPKKVAPSVPVVIKPANPVAVRPASVLNSAMQPVKPAASPKAAPQVLKPLPQGIKTLPQGLKALPQGLKPLPQGLKGLPQGLKPLPHGLKSLPQGLKPLPQGLKPLPQGLKAIPQGIKAVPLSSFPGIRLQKGAIMIATTTPKSKIANVKPVNARPIAPAPPKTTPSPSNKVAMNPAFKGKLVLSNPVSLATKPTAIRTPSNANPEKDPLAMSDDEEENTTLGAQRPPVLLNSGHVLNAHPQEETVRIKIEVDDTG